MHWEASHRIFKACLNFLNPKVERPEDSSQNRRYVRRLITLATNTVGKLFGLKVLTGAGQCILRSTPIQYFALSNIRVSKVHSVCKV